MFRYGAGLLLLAASLLPQAAAARQAECLMVVNGRTMIDGRCEFDSGPDGSFRLESGGFIGHVSVDRPGVGSGMWSAKPDNRSSYRETGALRRNGACWESDSATFCAWGLNQRPQGQRPSPPPPQQFSQQPAPRPSGSEACPPRGSARSVDANQTASVEFHNQTGAMLRLFWLDYNGERKHYADIQPNDRHVQQTYVSHPWILVDPQGGCAGGVYYPRAGGQRHVLAGANSPAQGGFAQQPAPRPQPSPSPQGGAPAGQRLETQPAAGGWQTLRYINEATGRVVRCGVQRDYSNGNMLRFTAFKRANDSIAITVHVASPRFDAIAMPDRFEVRYWIDDENTTQKIIAQRDGANGARFTENNSNEPGSEDGFANGKDLSVAIGQQVLSFPLRGSNPLFKALIECAHSELVSAQPPQAPKQQQAQAEILTANRFHPISSADLQKWNSSGCSFAVFRGRDNIAIFDTQDARKSALFKIDGRVSTVRAGSTSPGAHWSGTVAGHQVRLFKGKRNPNFRNDGGGESGEGRMDWSGPEGEGSIPVRWEEGC